MRKQAGLRLTQEALQILGDLSGRLGISRAAVVELAVRQYAANVQGLAAPPITPPPGSRRPRPRTQAAPAASSGEDSERETAKQAGRKKM
jgi:hypothetical protein